MAIEIKKGVPIPDRYDTRREYPFSKMEVGDSFEFPRALQTSVRGAARSYAARHNPTFEFITRRVNPTTCAIWRTK
jgi:hypothetical protein